MKVFVVLTILTLLITVPFTTNKGEVYKSTIELKKVDFNIAYAKLRRWEGNFVNDPDDFGKETYAGITKRYNPKWMGWYYVDNTRNKKWNQFIPECEYWVKDYYLTIWVNEGFYNLTNQELANYLFDIRIHLHTRQAVRLINETYGYNILYGSSWVSGNRSLDTITDLSVLKEKRKRFYLDLIKRKPHYKKFKANWLRRAEYV